MEFDGTEYNKEHFEKKEQARKNRNRGKANEKALAKILKGKRVGTMGGEDIYKDNFSFEAKSRDKFVAEKWMKQCEENCEGRIPIVVVHLTGQKHDNDLVIIRLKYAKDFIK